MKNKIVLAYLPSFILCSLFLLMSSVKAQPPDRSLLINALEKEGCIVTEDGKVKICKLDYKYKNKTVEAIIFRPNTEGKFPSLFLIPGYTGTAKTYLGLGIIFAKVGFASMSAVLIIHGENDLNAPTNQAYLLRDKLKEVGKDFEFQIIAGHSHGNLGGDFLKIVVDFFSRKLKGVPSDVKFR